MTVEARFSEKTADSKGVQAQNIETKVWQELGDSFQASGQEIARLDLLPAIKAEVPVQQAAQGPFATLESGRTALWYEEMRQDYKLPVDATKAQVEKAIRDTRWAKEDNIIRERNGGKLPAGDGRVGDALDQARIGIWYEDRAKEYGLPANATRDQIGKAIRDARWAKEDNIIRRRNGGKLPPGDGSIGDALDQARIGIWYEDMAKQHGLPVNAKREQIGTAIADARWKQEDAVIRMRNGGVLPPREQPVADDRLAGLYDSKEDFHYADWLSQYFSEQKIKDEKAQEDLRAIILLKKKKLVV
ncbi:MAG: hypothetical protein K2W82_06680 [Candidatus Obscuribacterales bacterium]|nr:hypothetical protein [Candidatus Obscuribacterales bacterium]